MEYEQTNEIEVDRWKSEKWALGFNIRPVRGVPPKGMTIGGKKVYGVYSEWWCPDDGSAIRIKYKPKIRLLRWLIGFRINNPWSLY